MTPGGLTLTPEVEAPSNPFPGLRPFEFNESHLYFGRDGQSDQLIRKLAATRFVAVVGTSGSGKSSLIRAGLLPDLYSGYMASAGSHWRMCIMRPGNDPLGNLARVLSAPGVFGSDDEENAQMQAAIAEATLRRGGPGLVEVVRQNQMPSNESLLVVVDQFEELFRFARVSGSEQYRYEAAAFVKLLLEAARQREHNVYVVLTMRSDFLGDCAQFWDLPEAINEGQYLIPRMSRDQRAEAITGPVAVGGGHIAQRLVNRLLNDVGDNPDQLPIMQHALMRTWECWKEDHEEGEPLDLRHYEAVGTMAEALSRHADEAFAELPDDRLRACAEKIFKALTEKGEDNREIRRPTVLKELCALSGATLEEAARVVEVFRREGRSFLMPPASVPLDGGSLIDISHESLIRNWARLKAWVDEESASAQVYVRLAETAVLHEQGRAGLWRDPDLQAGLDWRRQSAPTHAWAARYHPAFDSAMTFLDRSVEARDAALREEERRRQQEVRRARFVAVVFFALFMLSLAAFGYAYTQSLYAQEALRAAEEAHGEAEDERAAAVRAHADAVKQSEIAEFNKGEARKAEEHALQKREEAEKFKGEAEKQAQLARRQVELARAATEEALKARRKAEEFKAEADRQLELARLNEEKANAARAKALEAVVVGNRLRYAASIYSAQSAYQSNNVPRAEASLAEFDPSRSSPAASEFDVPEEKPGFEWYYLWQLVHGFEASLADESGAREGKCRGAANFVAYSADGRRLAYAGCGSITLRDAASNRVERFSSEEPVTSIAIAPDSKTIATGHSNAAVKIWEAGAREPLFTLWGHKSEASGNETEVSAVAFSPDGKWLVTGGTDNKALLWDTASYKKGPVALEGHTAYVNAVAFSPDRKTLATGSGGSVRLWDAASGRKLSEPLIWPDGMVLAMVFSPDGKSLVVSYKDGHVKEWDIPSRESRELLPKQPADINSLALSPAGRLATGSSDSTVKLWDVSSQSELATLKRHTDAVSSVSFSPDGRTLASAGMDGEIILWNPELQIRRQAPFKVHGSSVKAVAFSPVGGLIASGGGGGDRTVRLWDARTHQTPKTLTTQEKDIAALAFSPDGKTLAIGTEKKVDNVLLLDATSSEAKPTTLGGHTGIINALAFSPDGKLLATAGGDKTVRLWDVASCRVSCREFVLLSGFERPVLSLAFSPDNNLLAAADGSERLMLWDVSRCASASECAKPLLNPEARTPAPSIVLAFSPDGKTLAAGSQNDIVLVNIADGNIYREISGHKSAVIALTFSADGKTLASSDGLNVRLWSTSSSRELIRFDGDFTSVAFSRDGKTLAAGSSDGTVKFWHAAADDEVSARASGGILMRR